ncbi:MAG: response regulator [Chloroflexi bacterium]|nr:response regulator [Chloroflexota bacterium]
MPTPLRVLILEDSPADAELMVQELRRASFDPVWQRVDTREDYLAQLDQPPDIVLADYALPQFDALNALNLLRERAPETPFIVVSGTIGEEAAAAVMKLGAADYLLKDRLGRLGQAVAMALEQKQLREEKRRAEEALRESETTARALLESAPLGVVITDNEGRMVLVTSRAEEMFGYKRQELIGQPIEVLMPERFRNEHTAHRQAYVSAPRVRQMGVDLIARRKDGTEFLVDIALGFVDRPTGMLVMSFMADITERIRAEQQLRQLTARLLEVQEEERRQVAYDIHDGLGQLITAAAMHLEVFAGRREQIGPADVETEFERARRCVRDAVVEMRRLVSEVGPLLLEDVGLVEASRRFLTDTAERMNWETEFEHDGSGERLERIVETALFRIVQEALSNAAKHSDTRKLRISFKRDDGNLLLEIEDWGRGFDVDGVVNEPGRGRHVGLLGMRERAALIGGDFRIESAPGNGTRLFVRVPLSAYEEPAVERNKVEVMNVVEPGRNREQARQAITVLIADDHPMVREGLRAMLQEEGIEVIGEAANGADAVQRVQELDPAVVLMDVRMPDMDGLAATEVIKQTSPGTSVIVVTSYESKEYLRRAIEAGAAGYLLKGMSRDSLIEAIKLVKGGGSLVDARLLAELLREMGIQGGRFEGAPEGALEVLSPREQEVLRLLVEGLTNKEIAQQMHYSVGTVKNVVQRVIDKLGVSDRTQAAVYAVRAGISTS